MNISRDNKRRVIIALGLGTTTVLTLCIAPTPSNTDAAPPGEVMRLSGKLVDFDADHPDFNVGSTGHQAWNVNRALGADGRPIYDGGGATVASQWYDKDGHSIMPYGADPGLPGGHFDIDAYDEAGSKKPEKHVHEYDDKYDVTYIDLVNDEDLQYQNIIGADYPNDLRITFYNQHHGSGTYTFEAGADLQTGNAQDGFDATFSPAELTQLRVDLASLSDLRKSSPVTVKKDGVDRDDSFAIRMYDTVTDELVYELAVYHHYKGPVEPDEKFDRCGDVVEDNEGAFGAMGAGGISSVDSYDQWYRDELGVNQSARHDVSLSRGADGVYEYLSDSFFPADGRLLGNDGESHNNNFTYSISATFTYNECTAQFFEFEGNDDAWLFIDNEMVMDLGGTATPSGQRVLLDRLNLVDGETYQLDFFFAHRRPSLDSIFRMRTNMLLETTADLVSVTGSFD